MIQLLIKITKKGVTEYRVRYLGFSKDEDAWLCFEDMEGTLEEKNTLVKKFQKRKKVQ